MGYPTGSILILKNNGDAYMHDIGQPDANPVASEISGIALPEYTREPRRKWSCLSKDTTLTEYVDGHSSWVDANVREYKLGKVGDGDYYYVLSTSDSRELWMEQVGWKEHGRALVDQHVAKFWLVDDGSVLVHGEDLNLWREFIGWQDHGRSRIVQAPITSAASTAMYDYYLVDSVLMKKRAWNAFAPEPIASDVRSFRVLSDSAIQVIKNTGNGLFMVGNDGQIDANVRDAWTVDGDWFVVLGTDNNLWLEERGWQKSGRLLLSTDVSTCSVVFNWKVTVSRKSCFLIFGCNWESTDENFQAQDQTRGMLEAELVRGADGWDKWENLRLV